MAAKAAAPSASPLDSPAHRAAKEKFRKVDAGKQIAATGAIALLEQRTRSATFDVALSGGDTVPVRARLSKTDIAEVRRLFAESQRRSAAYMTIGENGDPVYTRPPTSEEVAASEADSNRILGLILYVEDMTPAEVEAWVGSNPDAVSDMDAQEIVLSFLAMLKREEARRKRIVDFRPQ